MNEIAVGILSVSLRENDCRVGNGAIIESLKLEIDVRKRRDGARITE